MYSRRAHLVRTSTIQTRHLYYGATYLFDKLSEELSLTSDLKQCFPDSYKKLLAIAYYLILEDNNPLYRFEKWNFTHKHPYGADITSPRNSEFFASITDEQVNKFFRLRGKRRVEEEYRAYDSNSISSYSETLAQVQYGKNKEDDKLPQLNLLLYLAKNPASLFITASWQGISLIPRRLSIFWRILIFWGLVKQSLSWTGAFILRKTLMVFIASM